MTRILLVEDDLSLGETLSERFAEEGYELRWARSCAQARTLADGVDLVIFDIGLPDGSGLDLAAELHARHPAPFLFLSALGSAENRLQGFEIGAADFVPKPFALKELLLRVRRVIEQRQAKPAQLVFPDFIVDLQSRSLRFSSGEQVFPQGRDFDLLCFMIQHFPEAVSRREVLEELWKNDPEQSGRTIDNAIVRLRQLLKDTAADPIRSVRGVGYQWVLEPRK